MCSEIWCFGCFRGVIARVGILGYFGCFGCFGLLRCGVEEFWAYFCVLCCIIGCFGVGGHFWVFSGYLGFVGFWGFWVISGYLFWEFGFGVGCLGFVFSGVLDCGFVLCFCGFDLLFVGLGGGLAFGFL